MSRAIAVTAFALLFTCGCAAQGDGSGPKGDPGEAGAAGVMGARGPAGTQGPAGERGDAGANAIVAAAQVINAAAGPFPVSGMFTSGGGTIVLLVDGSGFSGIGAAPIGLTVSVDGAQQGVVRGYVNEANTHRAMVASTMVVTGLAAGSHTVTLTALGATLSDVNDFFSVGMLEYR